LHVRPFQTLRAEAIAQKVLQQRKTLPSVHELVEPGVVFIPRLHLEQSFLRGVLTPLMDTLPEMLAPLSERAREALTILGDEVRTVSETALRFCLSSSEVSSVVIGVKTVEELQSNLAEAERGSLPREILEQLKFLGSKNDPLTDARNWQGLI
jgi:aryl-alcohol dehydrogenase-like predicted oxidoreductase